MRSFREKAVLLAFAVAVALLSGCRTGLRTVPSPAPAPRADVKTAARPASPAPANTTLPRMGYTVQAGAFSIADNARGLAAALTAAGLDAFYFPAESGLYKVRFGDFPSRDAAAREAKRFHEEGRIGDYFIVGPADYAVARPGPSAGDLREKLTATAESFIGVDYAWGGTTSRSGFDCSGLTRAVYQLNGLAMPRSVGEQYEAGTEVPRDRLMKGDLVFFSASPGGGLTHVGIYVGDNVFVHAPGKGKKVRRESLGNDYFRLHFSGARAYLRQRPPGLP
jgi:cell wall-associated NlpC family hydrolase